MPVESAYRPASYEPAQARGAWYEPAPVGGPPPPPGGYSPGPALTPIDGSRGAKLLGPLLALAVLAAIVVALVFVFVKVLGGDDDRDNNGNLAANGTPTAQSIAAPSGAATAGATEAPTEDSGATGETEPTGEPTGAETPEPTATPEPDSSEETRAPASARSMLPTTGDLPEGFQRTEDDKRAKEAVAASFSNSEEALSLLNEWEWRENAYRTFEIPADDGGDPNGMTYINISIHRFGAEQGAKDALTYFADDVMGTQGLEELDIERIGEQTRALKGAPSGANLVVLYIRVDNYLIRVGGSSPQGDPTDQVVAMAEQIVG
jgi:hypothetical protein